MKYIVNLKVLINFKFNYKISYFSRIDYTNAATRD